MILCVVLSDMLFCSPQTINQSAPSPLTSVISMEVLHQNTLTLVQETFSPENKVLNAVDINAGYYGHSLQRCFHTQV